MNIEKTTHIGNLVTADYRAADVFKDYGIDFCCQGNRTIEEACKTQNTDVDKLIQSLQNASSGTAKSGTPDFTSWPIDLLANYIESIHHKYIREKTPPLRAYLDKINQVHGQRHPELQTIRDEFYASTEALLHHIVEEETEVFPIIKKIIKSREAAADTADFLEKEILKMTGEHMVEGERFRKISALSNNYTPPADGCNTYRVTYALLKEYEEDLHVHIHLENNILFPAALEAAKHLAHHA